MSESEKKIVFLLGAGASHASDFNLPAMQGFFDPCDLKSGEYPNLLGFIERMFPGIVPEKLNLEEVITYIELALDDVGCFGGASDPNVQLARRDFDKYVTQQVQIPVRKSCERHKKLFTNDIAGDKSIDSIITLNYDLVVDNTLYDLSSKQPDGHSLNHGCLLDRMYGVLAKRPMWNGDRPSLYWAEKGLGFYLKLHGSVNWIYCPNPYCGNHQYFFPNPIGLENIHDQAGDLCILCGSPLQHVLVPPTLRKTFEQFPKLRLLWALAYRELNKADAVIIFGVSFADSDYYLRWLLKKSLTGRDQHPLIVDIDHDRTVCDKITATTGISPMYKETLDEFLECRDQILAK